MGISRSPTDDAILNMAAAHPKFCYHRSLGMRAQVRSKENHLVSKPQALNQAPPAGPGWAGVSQSIPSHPPFVPRRWKSSSRADNPVPRASLVCMGEQDHVRVSWKPARTGTCCCKEASKSLRYRRHPSSTSTPGHDGPCPGPSMDRLDPTQPCLPQWLQWCRSTAWHRGPRKPSPWGKLHVPARRLSLPKPPFGICAMMCCDVL